MWRARVRGGFGRAVSSRCTFLANAERMASEAHALTVPAGTRFDTDVPQRLDRLPWSPWHWRVVIALGITWMLDGLEVTLVGALAPALRSPAVVNLTEGQIGGAGSAYLFGAIAGALIFGRLTDMLGRKK